MNRAGHQQVGGKLPISPNKSLKGSTQKIDSPGNAISSKIRRFIPPSYQQLALRIQQDATLTLSINLWLQNDWAT
jgi:hypothetical protein